MSTHVTAKESTLLFQALAANGIFSLVSGVALVSLSGTIALVVGVADKRWLTGLGIVLVLFGASLLVHAYRKRVRRAEAIVISAMDLGWVVGSIVLVSVAPELFSTTGIIVVLSVAAFVGLFFELQVIALWRTRRPG